MGKIFLKKNEDKRIRAGHLWIFSNEIKNSQDIKENGEIVEIYDFHKKFVGLGYYNKNSLISVRLLSFQNQPISQDFFIERFQKAYQYRQKTYPDLATFRVVFSESDFLPGLIVDKYENYLSIQILTLGMEKLQALILEALEKVFSPFGIILRNDSAFRKLEGLPEEIKIIKGDFSRPVIIQENGLKFYADLKAGQKTGFFLDQKENRLKILPLIKGKIVLDLFCYSGAWGLYAAGGGAQEVLGVDESQKALDLAKETASLNNFSSICRYSNEDVFSFLREQVQLNKKYDLIISDPPAFVKSKNKLKEAKKGYKEINLQSLKLLTRGGILVTCSCSHHLSREDFLGIIKDAAQDTDRRLILLEEGKQARDHPILLSMPETEYLKCFVFMVQ